NPNDQKQFNEKYGLSVLAISDSVLIVVDYESKADEQLGPYDRLRILLWHFLVAQVSCVLNHGIFLRGGISHGIIRFENDVLVSDAFIKANNMESKCAINPFIVTDMETIGVIKSIIE